MNENRFNGKGNVYAKYRPSYPVAFLEFIYANFKIASDAVIADIGSGTGIFTKLLLDKGNEVYAVEPNDDMRIKAENDLKKFENFHSINGSAEHTRLECNSIDYITVAQAFHWFDVEAFRKECERILKPNGVVILVWNSRDETNEIIIENEKINKQYCKGFSGYSGGISGPMQSNNISDFFNRKFETETFENYVKFDKEAFVGRNLSSSYAPNEDDDNYLHYIKALETLFDEYSENGYMNYPYYTRCFYGILKSNN